MPGVGDHAPGFQGNDFVNGGIFNLDDPAYAGKVILLSFVRYT